MCGRYNVSDSPRVRKLMDRLRVPTLPETRRNIAPGAHGQFVIEHKGERQLIEGYWSLLIEPKPDKPGYRPNPKFKTFNARSDRLQSSPLWKGRYLHKRAIVPADGFHEWAGKQCHQIEQEGQAMALAALYDFWEFDGELIPAFSIITLPPHPRFFHIHDKSLPLMLEPKDFDLWLDPTFSKVDAFQSLMQPTLIHPLVVTPIKSAATLEAAGETEIIAADYG